MVAGKQWGVWTGCGQRQPVTECTPSRQQIARDDTAKFLTHLSSPSHFLSVQPADRQGHQCCIISAGRKVIITAAVG